MPELPEVETTKRGIAKHLTGEEIQDVIIRRSKLRWPIPQTLKHLLPKTTVTQVNRRAKYLLIETSKGTLIIHLGMSGHLRILPTTEPVQKHDHFDLIFKNFLLRFTCPRRFSAILWTDDKIENHPLLKSLGPEPLSQQFTPCYLQRAIKRRTSPIKTVIMNSKIVVGVGNIYANEALFLAGISPYLPANTLDESQCKGLVEAIQKVLKLAIKAGGTTLKDFTKSDGKPGYFQQQLQVYGRGNQPCLQCGHLLITRKLGQRQTVHCPSCQP